MMGKNKTALIIIVSVLALSLLLFFLPINQLVGNLPFINQFYNNTTLEILTKKGKARVWINGKDYGETPTTVENLPEGQYLIELERIAEGNSFYQKQSLQVDLTRNTSARIDLELGPEGLLHGSLLYYTPVKTASKEGFLTVISNVEHARIFLDKEFVKVAPITHSSLMESQYNVKVVAKGYEEVEVPVLVRNNYTLNLKTFHFPIPVTFDSIGEEIEDVGDVEKVDDVTQDTNE